MTKTDLIAAVAAKVGSTKKDAEKAVVSVFEAMEEALINGDKISIVGFGAFEVKQREARMGRNPRTKEPIEIPASKLPVFKAGKGLKDAVSK